MAKEKKKMIKKIRKLISEMGEYCTEQHEYSECKMNEESECIMAAANEGLLELRDYLENA